ncbi:MAG: TerB family tellurite resistance protein [Pararheinheimera sp.]|nr:TerB family tellurite resistance protein [Rheinheimera sp.]
MSFLGKLLGKKTAGVREEMKKMENRDLMQAAVGAALLVAYADGECEDSEVSKLQEVIASLPALSSFGPELGQTVDRYNQQLKTSFILGRTQIMREIADVKNNQQEAEDVLIVAITIAAADGEVEPKEQEVLKQIGRQLGLNPDNYV